MVFPSGTYQHSSSELTRDVKVFSVSSEQYYLPVDPVVEVLATTTFPTVDWYHSTNGTVEMPVVWTKSGDTGECSTTRWDTTMTYSIYPEAWTLMKRGLLWAAEGRQIAQEQGLTIDRFASERKMF
jgi:type 1 glutamine amidotransferase